MPVGNQGGFRFKGSVLDKTVRLAVLYTSGEEIDWPDHIEPTTGDFTYYGDNRKPQGICTTLPEGGTNSSDKCSRRHVLGWPNDRLFRRSSCSSE